MIHAKELMMLGMALACGAGLFAFHGAARENETRELQRQQELEQLQAKLEALEESEATRAQMAARLTRPVDWGRRPPETTDEYAETAEEPAIEEEVEQDAEDDTEAVVLASVHTTFDAEPNDATWSSDAKEKAEEAMSAGLPEGSTLERVECRTSLCKVETFHEDLGGFKSFVDSAFLGRERQIWNGGFYTAVVDHSDQGVVAVSYIAKEGQDVPLPATEE
jgi:hypothetical protein